MDIADSGDAQAMTIITPYFLSSPGCRAVFAALNDYETYIVGGAVRDFLLGKDVSDIDFATAARPEQIIHAATVAGLKAYPTGIAHGTITIAAHGKGYEATTFRRDVATDGRRATVAFSDTLNEDAKRRDFTINALYLSAKGHLLDPTGGQKHLSARHLCFIGDAKTRIAEDSLRILRYFRFFTLLGQPTSDAELKILGILQANKAKLSILSKERITTEIYKILTQPNPLAALNLMAKCAIADQLFSVFDLSVFAKFKNLEQKFMLSCDPFFCLLVLEQGTPPKWVVSTRRTAEILKKFQSEKRDLMPLAEMAYRFGQSFTAQFALFNAAKTNDALTHGVFERIAWAAQQKMPLKAHALPETLKGKEIGSALRRAEQLWINSGFQMSANELLTQLFDSTQNKPK